jgi:hypothetical protein
MFERKGFGVLSGAGAEDHYDVQEKPIAPHGVTYVVTCDNCGTEQEITIAWQQIVDASARKIPTDPETRMPWGYKDGKLFPQLGCARCRSPISIGMTPDEAERKVRAGVNAGFLKINR